MRWLLWFLIPTACHWFDPLQNHSYPLNRPDPGVVFYDYWRASDGVNLVNDETMKTCRVLDMQGAELGRLPGGFCLFLPAGQYFSNIDGPSLFDPAFSRLWSRPDLEQHHEAVYDQRRDWIWLLVYERETAQGKKRIRDRLLALERSTGRTVFDWLPQDGLPRLSQLTGISPRLLYSKNLQGWSLTHLNSIALGEGDDLLLSDTGSMGAVYVLDTARKSITWAWRPEASSLRAKDQHSAHYVADGGILTFINNTGEQPAPGHGLHRSFLAVLRPRDGKIEWTFGPTAGAGFFSIWFGNVTPLKNGNYLVTHIANGGGAFEVTPQSRVVWEWNNDQYDEQGRRRPVYRVTREARGTVQPYLRQWAKISNIP